MARLTFGGIVDIQNTVYSKAQILDVAVPHMLEEGAKVMVKAQREECKRMFSKDRSTGDLAKSIARSAVRKKGDVRYIEVRPTGKNRNGESNAKVGFVQEYGRSNMQARPWASTANEKCKDEVNKVMKGLWERGYGW